MFLCSITIVFPFHSFHSIYLKIGPRGTIDTHSKQHIKK